MRLTFLTHYYAPERGAPQTRLQETVRQLVADGVRVSVVTGHPHYPDGVVHAGYAWWRPLKSVRDGATIYRLPAIPRPNRGFADRVIDQASFAAVALAAAPVIARSDAFVVESPPLFLGATAAVLHRLTGTPYVFHVADPWPDFPIQTGALRGRISVRLSRVLERLAYESSSVVTTVTPPIVERLSANPAASGKVQLVPNAVDPERFALQMSARTARAELGWSERLTFVYCGTVGLAQGVGTLVEAVAQLPEDCDVMVRVVGGGLEAAQLEEQARQAGLDRISFHQSVAAERVPLVLAAADAILVLLRRGGLFDESLPTKLLEGFGCGRPVVLSADGYPAQLVVDGGAGIVAAAESATALRDALVAMASSVDRDAMAKHGLELAHGPFSRARSVGLLTHAARQAAGQREAR